MAMKIDRIQPVGMNVCIRQGKPAYSHVVTVTGPGKIIYIAGQLARDAEGNIVGPGDMRAQLEQTFKNLDACLKAAGATWADVVKTNTFVTDYQAFSQCSDVRKRASASRLSGEWSDDDYDVLVDGIVVGRIMKSIAAPVETPWMWTLAYGHHEDRWPIHGYETTREAAMVAFAKSWRRE